MLQRFSHRVICVVFCLVYDSFSISFFQFTLCMLFDFTFEFRFRFVFVRYYRRLILFDLVFLRFLSTILIIQTYTIYNLIFLFFVLNLFKCIHGHLFYHVVLTKYIQYKKKILSFLSDISSSFRWPFKTCHFNLIKILIRFFFRWKKCIPFQISMILLIIEKIW